MIVKVDSRGIINKLKKSTEKYNANLKRELEVSSERVRSKAVRRFSSRFRGSKYADVLAAIESAGIQVFQSNDDETTLFMYDMATMDNLTQQISPATGRIHHLWRILHEGSGKEGARTGSNHPNINARTGYLQAPYHIQAIVQTKALLPFFNPGRHPPFFELVQREDQGVKILRIPGFEGHAWFVQNNDLFDEDTIALGEAVRRATRRSLAPLRR